MDVLGNALQQGIAPAIVVAIYLIISKIIDTYKENSQNKITNDLVNSINAISDFLTDITKDIVNKDKDKCKVAINDSINSMSLNLINFVSTTIVNNHIIENKTNILYNIHNIVNAEYYSVYSTLSLYKINNVICSDYLNKEWINEIEKLIINIIYESDLVKEDKIIAFNKQIEFKCKSYITLILNNIIR